MALWRMMRKKKETFVSVFFFCLLICSALGRAADLNWDAAREEAGELLSRYIGLDTTNPPGNETVAAHCWREVLAKEQIEAQVFESQPGAPLL